MGTPKKLLMVTPYFETHRGGIEIAAGQLARALHRHYGLEITWAATGISPPPCDLPARCIPLSANNLAETIMGVPAPIPAPGAINLLRRLVREHEFILVHDTLYPSNAAAFRAARKSGIPVVIVQHIGLVPYRNPLLRAAMRAANAKIAKPMLEGADRTVFISGLTRSYFARICHFKNEPALIFNGLSPPFEQVQEHPDRNALRARLKLAPRRLTVLFVGRFVEKKGLHILRQLARANPDIEFCLVGWGHIAPEKWNCENVTVFRGVHGEKLISYYQAADIFLLPSVGEGFPLVIQEALACGLPVMCSTEMLTADPWLEGRVLATPVFSDDPGRTVALWHDALRRFASDGAFHCAPDKAEVVRRYAWKTIADQYLAVFEAASAS